MAAVQVMNPTPLVDSERAEMIARARENNASVGIAEDTAISITQLRDMQSRLGIDPETNGASRELMRMRYGQDWEKE